MGACLDQIVVQKLQVGAQRRAGVPLHQQALLADLRRQHAVDTEACKTWPGGDGAVDDGLPRGAKAASQRIDALENAALGHLGCQGGIDVRAVDDAVLAFGHQQRGSVAGLQTMQ